MRLAKRLSILLFAPMLSLAACGGDDIVDPVCTAPQGTDYTFVVNQVLVPTNSAEATQLALDIDGTEPIRNDNALGIALANLAAQANLDLKTAVEGAVNAGDIILLVNVKSEDLSNAVCAGVGVYLGANPGTEPCESPEDTICGRHLDGNTGFDISADSPTDTVIGGQILGGQFQLGPNNPPGNFTIELDLIPGAEPIALNLIGARVKISSVTETGLSGGILGGAITQEDLQTSIMPAIQVLVADAVAADCPGEAPDCGCPENSAGQLILNLFDTNDDCLVSVEEIQQNELVASILNPDLDLLDETGNYNPGADGVADSLSLGLGFSATTATFTPPQ
jgi:hypothetical protein